MTAIEKLATDIMKECEKEGEPVSFEDALEMAKMEQGSKEIVRYEKSDKPRKQTEKKRKIDIIKQAIIESIAHNLNRCVFDTNNNITDIHIVKLEREIVFKINNDEYSITLVKHRPKKDV